MELRLALDSLASVRMTRALCARTWRKLPPPIHSDVAIAAIFVRVADRKGSIGLPDDEAAVVDDCSPPESPLSLPALAAPICSALPCSENLVAAFSTVDVAQRAMGRALFGPDGHWRRTIALNIPESLRLAPGSIWPQIPWNCAKRTRKPKDDCNAL